MDRSKSLSAKYGIPETIIINDEKRFPGCDAHEAILQDVSPDGRTATYAGVCAVRHSYQEQFEVEELKRRTKVKIANGEAVYVLEDKQVNSGELEEF